MTHPAAFDSTGRLARGALLLCLLLGLAVRALYWAEVRDLPLFQEPTGDAATYVGLAEAMQQDGPLAPTGAPYTQGPLYPWFLCAMNALGFGLAGARAVQFALGVAGVGLLWILGRRLAGSIGAIVAAAGGALYGPFVFFEGELLSISFAVFLFELALVLWGKRRGAFAVGLCLGAAALAQPSFLLAGGLVAAASVVSPARWGWPDRRAALLLLAGLAALPVTTGIRNVAVSGEPVLISANGGINFFIGNNPDADGTFHLPPDSGLLNRPEGLFTSAREIAERDRGRSLSLSQVDRHWFLRGADYWIGEPARAVGLTARKALLALNNYELPNHYDYDYFRAKAIVLRFLPTLGWLLPLGGVGLALAWRAGQREWAALFLALLLSVTLFFVTARYRLPLAVLLWPACGLALERLIAWRRRPLRLFTVIAAAALYAGLAFIPLVQQAMALSHMANVEGATLLQQGDLSGAAQAFERALDANPNNPEALNNMGRALALQGKPLDAANRYRHALAVDPTQAETYFNIEDLYRNAGQLDEALDVLNRLEKARGGRIADVAGSIAYRRGVITYAKGDTAQALAYLEEAVTAQPDLAAAWLTLSVAYRKNGESAKALEAARRGAALAPNSMAASLALAAALVGAGDRMGALGAYQHAQELGNKDSAVRFEMGRLLVELGKDEDAESYLLAANEGAPHSAALLALGALYERAGRIEDARTAYETLTRLRTPQAGEARKRLRALGQARVDGRRR